MPNNNSPIGIFDSGLGGLTVVRALKGILPNESIIYFGDTGRVPYGSRSPEVIRQYARQDIDFLLSKNVKMVIAACGTVSSVAADIGNSLDVPFLEVVSPAAKFAAEHTSNKNIGIIGTNATINSGSYEKIIQDINPDINVFTKGCPLFVSIVEEGLTTEDNVIALETAKHYLLPLAENGIDTLILGCTHFPILKPVISKVLGDNVNLIDIGVTTAEATAKYLKENNMLSDDEGQCKFYVSDRTAGFSAVASRFLGRSIDGEIERISLEQK